MNESWFADPIVSKNYDLHLRKSLLEAPRWDRLTIDWSKKKALTYHDYRESVWTSWIVRSFAPNIENQIKLEAHVCTREQNCSLLARCCLIWQSQSHTDTHSLTELTLDETLCAIDALPCKLKFYSTPHRVKEKLVRLGIDPRNSLSASKFRGPPTLLSSMSRSELQAFVIHSVTFPDCRDCITIDPKNQLKFTQESQV